MHDPRLGQGTPGDMREPADAIGTIDVRVEDGIVTLDGDVAGPGQKRNLNFDWSAPGAGQRCWAHYVACWTHVSWRQTLKASHRIVR